MKSKDFLALVEKMMTKQQDYRSAKRKGAMSIVWEPLLWAANDLERQVWAVIRDGVLEPDEAAIERLTDEQVKEYWRLVNQHQIELKLDLLGSQRPTVNKET